jgi:hypothetical protein
LFSYPGNSGKLPSQLEAARARRVRAASLPSDSTEESSLMIFSGCSGPRAGMTVGTTRRRAGSDDWSRRGSATASDKSNLGLCRLTIRPRQYAPAEARCRYSSLWRKGGPFVCLRGCQWRLRQTRQALLGTRPAQSSGGPTVQTELSVFHSLHYDFAQSLDSKWQSPGSVTGIRYHAALTEPRIRLKI